MSKLEACPNTPLPKGNLHAQFTHVRCRVDLDPEDTKKHLSVRFNTMPFSHKTPWTALNPSLNRILGNKCNFWYFFLKSRICASADFLWPQAHVPYIHGEPERAGEAQRANSASYY